MLAAIAKDQPNFGIIARTALRYWRKLPAAHRASYDLEDLVSEVMLAVIQASSRYRSRQALPSTFVWWVAENHCKMVLQRFTLKKRYLPDGMLVSEEELFVGRQAHHSNSEFHFLEAKEVVERVIADASQEFREFFSHMLCHERPLPRIVPPRVKEEWQRLAARHGATFRDFQIIFSEL